jgi:hypothetical protein
LVSIITTFNPCFIICKCCTSESLKRGKSSYNGINSGFVISRQGLEIGYGLNNALCLEQKLRRKDRAGMSDHATSSEMLAQALAELKMLRQQVAAQQKEIAALKAAVNAPSNSPADSSTTRRRMLKKLGAALLTGMVVTGATASPPAQARVISGANPGAYVMPGGVNITGSLPAYRYGLIASSDITLDLGDVLPSDTGVTGICTSPPGAGVYGFCDSDLSYGVLGYNISSTGTGVYGYTNGALGIGVYGYSAVPTGLAVSGGNQFGTAIYGDSGYSYGVHGRSAAGAGLVAESTTGVPFHIVPGSEPSDGTRHYGDIYVDTSGNIFIWADGASPISPGWRQLQFAT